MNIGKKKESIVHVIMNYAASIVEGTIRFKDYVLIDTFIP